jgi:hypothetical protein
MALLSDEIKKEVQIELQGLKNEVKLIVFYPGDRVRIL